VRKEPQAEALEAIFAAFASLVVDVDLVRKIARWSMHVIRESPLYKLMYTDLAEARAEARAEGLVEGRAEGHEAAVLILRRFLAFRFQIPETQFDSQLDLLDLEAIKQLSDIVIDVPSLADFERALLRFVSNVETGAE
jgi:hypothetical protein